jgi:hypothetical protein
VSWALHAGFVLGRHGDLALTPQAMRDAIILGAVALLATILATLIRVLRHRVRAATVTVPAPRSVSTAPQSQPVPRVSKAGM